MTKTLLFVLFLAHQKWLSSLATNNVREYHYVKQLKTWAEAQSYCRETFTDLTTVNNQDDNDRLLSASQAHRNFAWIGLYDDLTRWKWSLANADFNNDTDFSNWLPKEPNNKKSKQKCTAMNKDGLWSDRFCKTIYPAVCYYEKGPSWYILVNTKMTWLQAKKYCKSNYTDLVSVRNMSENNHIAMLLEKTAWIGLYRKGWAQWSDQTPRSFLNWNEGQPDNSGNTMESCVVMNTTTGKWWDADCQEKHHFICQKIQVQHKKSFKLKFQLEADLNDPAVQQQLLEQLHAKLEKHGLSDFKLRWIQTDGQMFHKEQSRKKDEGVSSCIF